MSESSSGKGDFGKRLAHKALMPIVATAASAAAGYIAKKGPSFFEESVLPKLKDAASGAADAASGVPERAKQAVGGAGDLAEGLTSRAKETAGSVTNGHQARTLSRRELEQHLEKRAAGRAERRKSTRTGS